MTLGKWDNDGVANFSDDEITYASYLNVSLQVTPPIGAVMAWLKSFTGVPALPDGWHECDGSVLSDADSPLNGQTLPNLNGNANVLYGASTSGGTKNEDFVPPHTHDDGTLAFSSEGSATVAAYYGGSGTYTGNIDGDTGSTTSGTALAGYAVVWIMRVK